MSTLADLFYADLGSKEWDEVVKNIQLWYYNGSFPKTSWCATSVSYYASKLIIEDEDQEYSTLTLIGGKNENVNRMRIACQNYYNTHSQQGLVRYYSKNSLPEELYEGDILFYLWSGDTMSDTSSKHVSVCYEDTVLEDVTYIPSIGGNQNHSIKISNYSKSNLYAVYRINYSGEVEPEPEPPPPPPSPPEPTPSPESRTRPFYMGCLKRRSIF